MAAIHAKSGRILLNVARDNPHILTAPAPSAELEEFGADSLEFKLYAFIDLNKGGGTSTDLRIAILDAFEEAGIASPSRRTDVTLRSTDWLRGMVAESASDPYNGRALAAGGPAPRHFQERDGQSVQQPTTHLRRNRGPVSA